MTKGTVEETVWVLLDRTRKTMEEVDRGLKGETVSKEMKAEQVANFVEVTV